MKQHVRQRLKVGYVGVAFTSYFAEEYNQYGRAIDGLRVLSEQMDFDLVSIAYPVTDVALAEKAANELRAGEVDYLMIQCASVASGELLPPLGAVAPRIGIWGTPDPDRDGPIKIHSLVAVNHYASIVRRYLGQDGPMFKWFFGHVDDDDFILPFVITVRALQAIKAMSTATVGWLGGNSPGFYNMEFDAEAVRERLGTRVVAHDFTEIVDRAHAVDESAARAVVADLTAAASEVLTSDTFMEQGARLYLALKGLAEDDGHAALAVQCWPKFQEIMGIAPCMAYSWLGSEDGFAVSCEGDVPGALSMLLLNELSDRPGSSTLLDMTALDVSTGSLLMWHCGVTPRHFANSDGIRWVDHTTLGRKSPQTFGVAGDHVFAAQDVTIAYVGSNASKLLVVRARIEERTVTGFDGTRGWFTAFELNGEPIELGDLVNTLITSGHEHHYAVAQGDLTDELLEIAAWLNMETINRIPRKNYLQRLEVVSLR
ncbi:hypothetical protein MNBD_ACTINO02-2011 [hydrothermal vent metagenome]|uniref:L-fucose isomerase C-terminal domain-containing protein n=1 Tax=hydrothermal vent metagenome TaxID=652676 RepID=A0A3B0SG64_9ZZZZ